MDKQLLRLTACFETFVFMKHCPARRFELVRLIYVQSRLWCIADNPSMKHMLTVFSLLGNCYFKCRTCWCSYCIRICRHSCLQCHDRPWRDGNLHPYHWSIHSLCLSIRGPLARFRYGLDLLVLMGHYLRFGTNSKWPYHPVLEA